MGSVEEHAENGTAHELQNGSVKADDVQPLLTPYKALGLDLDIRIVYAPLTRCRAVGEFHILGRCWNRIFMRDTTCMSITIRCGSGKSQQSVVGASCRSVVVACPNLSLIVMPGCLFEGIMGGVTAAAYPEGGRGKQGLWLGWWGARRKEDACMGP